LFKTISEESNPLLGEAEAEGFGVGVGHEEPTPALRSTPPERGFPGRPQLTCKVQVETTKALPAKMDRKHKIKGCKEFAKVEG